ncbi:MAG: glycosyltransferase family 2 protein [Bacillota bacterium]
MNNKNISVLIPAFNEEKNIIDTILGLKKIPSIKQIIVIDDGSSDSTSNLCNRLDVEIITLKKNGGKGNALNVGSKYIIGDFIALVDGDLGLSSEELKKLINPVVSGTVDMTIAAFPPASRKGGFGVAKKTAGWGLKFLTREDFKAPLSGQRFMKREVFESLLPFSSGFGVEVGMTLDAILKGYTIREIRTDMGHEETGRNLAGFLHRGRQLKDIFITLTKKGWRKWALS